MIKHKRNRPNTKGRQEPVFTMPFILPIGVWMFTIASCWWTPPPFWALQQLSAWMPERHAREHGIANQLFTSFCWYHHNGYYAVSWMERKRWQLPAQLSPCSLSLVQLHVDYEYGLVSLSICPQCHQPLRHSLWTPRLLNTWPINKNRSEDFGPNHSRGTEKNIDFRVRRPWWH